MKRHQLASVEQGVDPMYHSTSAVLSTVLELMHLDQVHWIAGLGTYFAFNKEGWPFQILRGVTTVY